MKVTIREMEIADIPIMMELEKELFSVPWSEAMFSEEIKGHYTYVLQKDENKEIIGYICGWKLLDEFTITNIGITANFQRMGFGAKLVKFIISKLLYERCFKFTLEVRESNQKAIALYEKIGFEQIGLRGNYYRDPVENAVIMRLNMLQKIEGYDS
jgi:ribosomal-protein-alanine N-acetyltransferase